MADADVLAQTVLVLEVLLAVLAHLRLLGRVLGPDVAPQIHRRDHQLAVAALRPLGVAAIRCCG